MQASLTQTIRQPTDGPEETLSDAGETGVIELLGSVSRRVIPGITVKRRIRHHERAVLAQPERGMVTPRDAGDESKRGGMFQGEIG